METKTYKTDGKVKHFTKGSSIDDKLSSLLGSRYSEYRKQWDAAAKFEFVPDFPLFLQFDLHQVCNMHCVHCIKFDIEIEKDAYKDNEIPLDWNSYKRIIDEGKDYKCPSMSPCGINEPLAKKDLEKHIKYAHDNGFIDIIMNTNALLMNEERARKLLDSGLTRLRFSLDAASKETYLKSRGRTTYDKAVKNIDYFLNLKEQRGYKLPITGVNFCVMSVNEHETHKFKKLWQEKVDIVTLQTFVPPIFNGKFNYLYPTKKDKDLNEAFDTKRCPQPFQRVFIRNYDITPCCAQFSQEISIGNVHNETIHDAWHSASMKKLRDIHLKDEYHKNETCKVCMDMTVSNGRSQKIA